MHNLSFAAFAASAALAQNTACLNLHTLDVRALLNTVHNALNQSTHTKQHYIAHNRQHTQSFSKAMHANYLPLLQPHTLSASLSSPLS